jgi:hypothetical protein
MDEPRVPYGQQLAGKKLKVVFVRPETAGGKWGVNFFVGRSKKPWREGNFEEKDLLKRVTSATRDQVITHFEVKGETPERKASDLDSMEGGARSRAKNIVNSVVQGTGSGSGGQALPLASAVTNQAVSSAGDTGMKKVRLENKELANTLFLEGKGDGKYTGVIYDGKGSPAYEKEGTLAELRAHAVEKDLRLSSLSKEGKINVVGAAGAPGKPTVPPKKQVAEKATDKPAAKKVKTQAEKVVSVGLGGGAEAGKSGATMNPEKIPPAIIPAPAPPAPSAPATPIQPQAPVGPEDQGKVVGNAVLEGAARGRESQAKKRELNTMWKAVTGEDRPNFMDKSKLPGWDKKIQDLDKDVADKFAMMKGPQQGGVSSQKPPMNVSIMNALAGAQQPQAEMPSVNTGGVFEKAFPPQPQQPQPGQQGFVGPTRGQQRQGIVAGRTPAQKAERLYKAEYAKVARPKKGDPSVAGPRGQAWAAADAGAGSAPGILRSSAKTAGKVIPKGGMGMKAAGVMGPVIGSNLIKSLGKMGGWGAANPKMALAGQIGIPMGIMMLVQKVIGDFAQARQGGMQEAAQGRQAAMIPQMIQQQGQGQMADEELAMARARYMAAMGGGPGVYQGLASGEMSIP